MSKIVAGVFLGVFISALTWEIFARQNPDLSEKIRKKFKEKIDHQLEPETAAE
ncbi:hypothetical protein H8E50_01410 [bacterium]|nr:hypothetical protein [bacterium]